MAALLQLSGIRRSYRSGEQTVEVLAEFLAALDEHFDPDPFRD